MTCHRWPNSGGIKIFELLMKLLLVLLLLAQLGFCTLQQRKREKKVIEAVETI